MTSAQMWQWRVHKQRNRKLCLNDDCQLTEFSTGDSEIQQHYNAVNYNFRKNNDVEVVDTEFPGIPLTSRKGIRVGPLVSARQTNVPTIH